MPTGVPGGRPVRWGRVVLALASVIILTVTGYAFYTLRDLAAGFAGSDVIDSAPDQSDGATDILLIGNDSRTDAHGNPLPESVLRQLRTTDEGGNLTDTMILVRVPNGGGRASAVSFPRDTLVQLGSGFGEQKLTEAMSRAQADSRDRLVSDGVTDPALVERQARQDGQRFLIKTIERLSGVSIDHYAEVNLLGFFEITQAVGGVEVCLREAVDDSAYSGAVFRAGRQTIQGADALSFVRQRNNLPRGDLDRVVRQQVFISGLARKILSSGTLTSPSKLAALTKALQRSVVLDQGWDVVSFAQRMHGIAAADIEFHTIPVELAPDGTVQADRGEVAAFVDDLLLSPQQRSAEQHHAALQDLDRSQITINLHNSSGLDGLDDQVGGRLLERGYAAGQQVSAPPHEQSAVRYAQGERVLGRQVAESLGGLPVEVGPELPSGHVTVVLGTDYDGPGGTNLGGRPVLRLDGARAQQPPPPAAGITAGDVPCVN